MLILCVYEGRARYAPLLRIYLRRGNIVSFMFIWLGRLAMPLFCGRKATKSHVFLFCNKEFCEVVC